MKIKDYLLFAVLFAVLVSSGCGIRNFFKENDNNVRLALMKQAKRGNADAQYALGMRYCCGFGPGHNGNIARKWLCKAAKQGHVEAQYQLGRYYDVHSDWRSRIDTQDAVQAYMWYSLAAQQGFRLAATRKVSLEQILPDSAVVAAAELQKDWEKLSCR